MPTRRSAPQMGRGPSHHSLEDTAQWNALSEVLQELLDDGTIYIAAYNANGEPMYKATDGDPNRDTHAEEISAEIKRRLGL